MYTVTITSKTGVRFLARILNDGDVYGRTGALIWHGEPGVEFYDTRYAHTEFGQFVSRYHVSVILEGTTGLDLHGGVPDWSIDAAAMDQIRSWLRSETEEADERLHAHFATTSSDCDGQIDRDYIIVQTDEEQASEFGDIEFHNRVVAMVVNSYSLDATGTLQVTKGEDFTRLEWSEPTEEGYRNTEATFCSDRCDDAETSYRDHRAESMGY